MNSQFNYASVIWMFFHKKDYLKIEINPMQTFYYSSESYGELLSCSNEVSIHQKKSALSTDIYQSLADINPDFMKPCFIIKKMPYNLRNGCALKLSSANFTYYGINSVLFRVCLLWNQLPLSAKQSQSLLEFKSKKYYFVIR